MTAEEWLFTIAVITIGVLSIISRHLAYKHGVWDGAFNQFIPYVRKSILEYDERRGAEILERYDDR